MHTGVPWVREPHHVDAVMGLGPRWSSCRDRSARLRGLGRLHHHGHLSPCHDRAAVDGVQRERAILTELEAVDAPQDLEKGRLLRHERRLAGAHRRNRHRHREPFAGEQVAGTEDVARRIASDPPAGREHHRDLRERDEGLAAQRLDEPGAATQERRGIPATPFQDTTVERHLDRRRPRHAGHGVGADAIEDRDDERVRLGARLVPASALYAHRGGQWHLRLRRTVVGHEPHAVGADVERPPRFVADGLEGRRGSGRRLGRGDGRPAAERDRDGQEDSSGVHGHDTSVRPRAASGPCRR